VRGGTTLVKVLGKFPDASDLEITGFIMRASTWRGGRVVKFITSLSIVLTFAQFPLSTGADVTTTSTTTTTTLTTTTTSQLATTTSTSNPATKKKIVTRTTTTTIDQGLLPHTSTEPSIATQPGSGLDTLMVRLWGDILTNNTRQADSMLFPEAAYEKIKAIPYPQSDYVNRLLYLFNLDIGAYRQFLLARGKPVLLRAETSPADAQWIPAGACYNKIGYWHLPGVRFVYHYGSAVYSVGVLSMISWRGMWYFIHLGQYTATGSVGQIYDFSQGPGEPGPAGSC
jgi:hypothetical protein